MFNHKSFSPVSFSIASFKMVQEDSARSGYWRLFYYQLQEKSLAEQSKAEALNKPTAFPNKKEKPKTAVQKVVEQEAQECPVPRRKLFVQPQRIPSVPLPDMMWVYGTLNELRFTFPHKRSIVRLSEPSVAANETSSMGNEVLLLLLAA